MIEDGLTIRSARQADWDGVWTILEPVVRAGDTLAFPLDSSSRSANSLWMAPSHEVFLAEDDSGVVGSYFLRPSHAGPGAHVCNASFVVARWARGRSIGRRLGAHALETAAKRGYRAMQFNLVVSSNTPALKLRRELGFQTVGRLPGAFAHPERGYVDALVMFKSLVNQSAFAINWAEHCRRPVSKSPVDTL